MSQFSFDPEGLEIVETLQRHRFEAYFVGGCVRDLLMGRTPKDFDIATNAKPRDIKRLIHHSYIIGKRFQLVLARRGQKQFEIATFRKESPLVNHYQWVDENLFGTPEDDAKRRDFTLNALFYDPTKKKLLDFVHGAKDIQTKTIRVIGSPILRFQEDPLRMLRAIRFAARLGFHLAPETIEGIRFCAHHLALAVPDRLREELLRTLREGAAHTAWKSMMETEVMSWFLPAWSVLNQYHLPSPSEKGNEPPTARKKGFLQSLLSKSEQDERVRADHLLEKMLNAMDEEFGEPVPVPLALSAFFLPVVRLSCFAEFGTWQLPEKNRLGEMKFFSELHQSLRLSHQESAHIRFLLTQRLQLFSASPSPDEWDRKSSLIRIPGFAQLLQFCRWEASAYRSKMWGKRCEEWQRAYEKALDSGFKPRLWEAPGPWDRPDRKAAEHATRQPDSNPDVPPSDPSARPKRKRRRRRRNRRPHGASPSVKPTSEGNG